MQTATRAAAARPRAPGGELHRARLAPAIANRAAAALTLAPLASERRRWPSRRTRRPTRHEGDAGSRRPGHGVVTPRSSRVYLCAFRAGRRHAQLVRRRRSLHLHARCRRGPLPSSIRRRRRQAPGGAFPSRGAAGRRTPCGWRRHRPDFERSSSKSTFRSWRGTQPRPELDVASVSNPVGALSCAAGAATEGEMRTHEVARRLVRGLQHFSRGLHREAPKGTYRKTAVLPQSRDSFRGVRRAPVSC